MIFIEANNSNNEQVKFYASNDYVFKRIFGRKGNEKITQSLISSVIGKKVNSLSLDENPILEPDLISDKLGILDIKATIDDVYPCDIEMQIIDKKYLEKRILFYWAKLYVAQMQTGDYYDKLNKTISIIFVKDKMNLLEDIPKLHTKWQIVEEEFSTKLLTTDLEIHIISLAKINDMSTKDISLNPKLALWSNFLLGNNLEELDMEIDEETLKEMKEAQRICDDINSSAKERYLAELRLKYIRDNKAIEEYGYDKGKKDSKLEMARKMLNSNFSIDKIIEITELTKEEIESLN